MDPRKLAALAKTVDEQGDAVRGLIRAYHGSPYDWDKVDMSMVTKGEGPLDEGYGFYATDRQGVADWYRNATTVIRRRELARQLREIRQGTRASPLDPHEPGKELDWHRRMMHASRLAREVRPQLQRLQREFPRGRTYELEIAVPRDSLMEYDVPIANQQPGVLEKMRSVNPGLVDDLAKDPDADGALFYTLLSGGNVIDPPTLGGQRRASEMLFKSGIPGHAYRGNADNYVFYPGTEDSIRILRKYAVPGAVGTGAASQMGEE